MYTPFQEATYLPIDLQCDTMKVRHDWKKAVDPQDAATYRKLPLISASAARTADGRMVVSLVNVSLNEQQELSLSLDGFNAMNVSGRILTSSNVADFNDFSHPQRVAPVAFRDARLKKNVLSVKLPARSVVVLTLEP